MLSARSRTHTHTPPFFYSQSLFISWLTLRALDSWSDCLTVLMNKARQLKNQHSWGSSWYCDIKTDFCHQIFCPSILCWILLLSFSLCLTADDTLSSSLSHTLKRSLSTSHCAASAVAMVIPTMNTANKDPHSDSGPHEHIRTPGRY